MNAFTILLNYDDFHVIVIPVTALISLWIRNVDISTDSKVFKKCCAHNGDIIHDVQVQEYKFQDYRLKWNLNSRYYH